MAIDINTDDRLTGGGTVTDPAQGLSQVAGYGGAILPAVRVRYSYGTGNAQVTKWYLNRHTLAAGAYLDLNLTSGLTALGAAQAFAALKRVVVALVAPDGTKRLRVGPQGRTNAAQLWFQAVTANFWEETYTLVWKDRPVTGWPVTAGAADVLSIHNPGAASVDCAVWLLGN